MTDLGELTPCVMGRGHVVSILPVGRNLWVLTRQSVCALLERSAHAWPLPEKGEWLAADDDGAVVCTRRGLFLPLTKTWWPLALRGPIGVVTLTSSTVVIDGGEDSGHPTDRSNWRLVVDRTTGVPGPLTITGQGGFWSASCERTAVRTQKGEACLRNGVLSWQGRKWLLPGGATTLAAEGDGLLVGTDQGKVYRLG